MTEVFGIIPLPGVEYPLAVDYCGNCTMPLEYCEYYPTYDKCKQWLEKNLPEEFAKLSTVEGSTKNEDEGEEEKKRQKRGGKGMVKAKKKEEGPKRVFVFLEPRGKKKTTVVNGLKTFDIDLKVASKTFGTKFACGSSVTGEDEIVLQGDIKLELLEFIPNQWKQIDKLSIEDGGEHKR